MQDKQRESAEVWMRCPRLQAAWRQPYAAYVSSPQGMLLAGGGFAQMYCSNRIATLPYAWHVIDTDDGVQHAG